jgi:DNA-binding MarR family transcriptional regulator
MVAASRGSSGGSGAGYWYERDDSAVELLTAVRSFRRADQDLRRRMSAGMDMNTTDLAALRHVIAHELADDPVTPLALAHHLGISGASTSKLLDRLTASGHLDRVPHPRDGRSRIVVATDHAHEQVRDRLSRMHQRMLEIAQDVPPSSRRDAVEFLHALAEQLDSESSPEELTPRGPAVDRAGWTGPTV